MAKTSILMTVVLALFVVSASPAHACGNKEMRSTSTTTQTAPVSTSAKEALASTQIDPATAAASVSEAGIPEGAAGTR